jgi:hypothetical protein
MPIRYLIVVFENNLGNTHQVIIIIYLALIAKSKNDLSTTNILTYMKVQLRFQLSSGCFVQVLIQFVSFSMHVVTEFS